VLASVLLQFANNYSSIKINSSSYILQPTLHKHTCCTPPCVLSTRSCLKTVNRLAIISAIKQVLKLISPACVFVICPTVSVYKLNVLCPDEADGNFINSFWNSLWNFSNYPAVKDYKLNVLYPVKADLSIEKISWIHFLKI